MFEALIVISFDEIRGNNVSQDELGGVVVLGLLAVVGHDRTLHRGSLDVKIGPPSISKDLTPYGPVALSCSTCDLHGDGPVSSLCTMRELVSHVHDQKVAALLGALQAA